MMRSGFAASDIDTSKPHPARIYNYFCGGKDNYAVDQAAARELPRIAPEARAIARANRAFLQRAVRFLAGECGIRQFLDIGTGIPAAGNVHEVAQQVASGSRVVYVDNDPIVHVHANALLTGDGNTSIVLADLRDPQAILAHPQTQELIDFTQPAALLLVAILHFVTDAEDPVGIMATFRDALAPGSYLALSHATGDFHPADTVSRGAAVYDRATAPMVPRSRDQIAAYFDGFELVEPGLVQPPLWRPDDKLPRPRDIAKIAMYAGVGHRAK